LARNFERRVVIAAYAGFAAVARLMIEKFSPPLVAHR
jgi:hypothetical protein